LTLGLHSSQKGESSRSPSFCAEVLRRGLLMSISKGKAGAE